jgi:hypothetical protein
VHRFIKSLLFVLPLLISNFFSFAQSPAKLKPTELNEISGLVVSRHNMIYLHNDSGDTSRFFAVDRQGELLATYYFKGNPAFRSMGVADCEDMASGPGPDKGKMYLYLGDIGDNNSTRRYISVYRFQEPGKRGSMMHLNSEAVHLKYPNGPQDSEAMMVDPVLRELIIISKRQDTLGIYSTSLSFKDRDTITLQKKGSLFLNGSTPSLKQLVSGDISRDGKQVLLKTYEKVYYWQRTANEPLNQTLLHKPLELPYTHEPQGEAIGFTPNGKGYYCISEGVNAVIYHYRLHHRLKKPTTP